MVEAHIGDIGRAVVKMRDANGNETDRYDVMEGVKYTSSNPEAVSVQDDDAEPRDARVDFLALTTEPVLITVEFDGDPGDGLRVITLQSDEINVVPGEATGGEVMIEFVQV